MQKANPFASKANSKSFDPKSVSQRQAQSGMDVAMASALSKDPEWAEKAHAFLSEYARNHQFFISEDVSDSSKATGLLSQPPTDRAWGSVYRRLAGEGMIVIDGSGRSRRRHGSICPLWRSIAFSSNPTQ